ncbi:tRNA (guanosine(46)-N7)-methyltransferase TrmB [Campylobacter sp. JMF_04 NA10]|uniref:tRNA (guanosine(46)-N7)-methyltransferase TrmB n=1 Tax=Campylobacter sp. JMF_04 NA10 TaxID=2983824 RepID=UPI0022E9B27F|nr:tRNA (guanosine(46)-N7)-methyltransferase TrmB [Campylobacter sp. JMF_04 NA10]MDA3075818.1 tRNA (guanosine(46)-N7)-methyltransferase TrmB [Campylobacter sp. JMF_04 NA10]
MPNFIAKSVELPRLPFSKEGVELLESASDESCTLVRTRCFDSEFFVTLKYAKDKVVVKGEKTTKPAKIGILQRALEIYEREFASGVIFSAFAFKSKSLTQKTPLVLDEDEMLNLLKTTKFSQIFVEIGFGSGRHLLYQARTNPQTLVIGIEIYKPSIEQVAKLAIKEGLENVALINTDARILLSLMPANLLSRIFLHFPVPWDDAPHRRVISDEFVHQCVRTLKKGAKFELRTDSDMYFEYALDKFGVAQSAGRVAIEHFKNRDLSVSSKYEDRWRKMDKNIFDLIFTNSDENGEEPAKFDMNFSNFNPQKIEANFKNLTIKGEGYFVHFERIYKFDDSDEVLILTSFGAFDFPQQCFIRIGAKTEYFLKTPLATSENYKAHKKIMEIFELWQA